MDREPKAMDPDHDRRVDYLHSASYDLFILILTIFSLVVVGLFLLPLKPAVDAILLFVDFILCAFFLLDFFLTLRRAPSKIDYLVRRGGWLDLLGSIPAVPGLPWTALFRLARMSRLIRIVRHLQGKDRDDVIADARNAPARTALLSTILTAILLITTISLFILRFERGAPGAQIRTGADAFWWSFVTMTTVGYGDYVPVTIAGRLLAIILMTFGIGIFAVLTSFMASRIVSAQEDQEDIVAQVREENAIIRAELAEIKELLKQQRGHDE
jgi:voltage-gated potassium channel